jgi:ferrous iron transport protein B
MTKILLMGNPNVGKSALFSRLTGVQTIVSNYPGTTISYTQGYMKLGEEKAEVIDAPGTYTLEPTSEAEEIARKLLDSGDIVINVVNAINLERNLYLTLQLLERGIPVVVALNLHGSHNRPGDKGAGGAYPSGHFPSPPTGHP